MVKTSINVVMTRVGDLEPGDVVRFDNTRGKSNWVEVVRTDKTDDKMMVYFYLSTGSLIPRVFPNRFALVERQNVTT